jgi:FHA domain
MLEKLREIDTSAIEKLVKIKKEQDRLVGFLGKADEMKDKVDDAVYRRVRADYESRDSALEKEAAPLKEEARGEYEKLCSIYDQLQEALDQAREAKEELEFRHAVGEFDKTQLAEKLKEPEEALEQCQSQLGDTDKLKAQFLAAFHSEEELKGTPQVDSEGPFEIEPEPKMQPEIEPEVQTEIIPEVQSEIEPKDDSTVQFEVEPELEALPFGTEPPIPESSTDRTFVRPKSDASEETFVEPQTKLFMVKKAKLVMVKKGEPSDEYPLGVLNYIGRAEDNHIRLTSQTVSRKHALLTASATGFTVKDLESRSGTFVNEEKVTECILADGDRIKVGEVELVFRSA